MKNIKICKFIFKDMLMIHFMNYDPYTFYSKKIKMYEYKRNKSTYRYIKKMRLKKNMIIRFYLNDKLITDENLFKNTRDGIITMSGDDIIYSFSMAKIYDILFEKGYEGLIDYLKYTSTNELNGKYMFELSYMIIIDSSDKIIHVV